MKSLWVSRVAYGIHVPYLLHHSPVLDTIPASSIPCAVSNFTSQIARVSAGSLQGLKARAGVAALGTVLETGIKQGRFISTIECESAAR